jgi:stress-induced morphogen
MTESDRISSIEKRLRESLTIQSLEIIDESHLHVGHAGAASGGGHFQVIITAVDFEDLNTLARHRLVYKALEDAMETDIHALSIKAYASSES